MIFQMPELHYTSKDDGHIHIAMLNDDLTGVAIGPNHNHIITFDDAVKNFRIVETDGHTHTLNGVVEFKASKLKSESDDDEMRTMMNLYRLALEHECESKERAKEARDFVNNKQWGGDERNSLESEDRACLTINITKTLVDMLKGYQRKNRTDIKLMPKEGSDIASATAGTALLKHIFEGNNYTHEESMSFDDTGVDGRGFLTAYVDYDKSIKGEIVIERVPASKVTVGPHSKIDMSDAEFLFKEEWFSRDKLKQLYGDRADEIENNFILEEAEFEDEKVERYHGNQYVLGGKPIGKMDLTMVDGKKKNLKVMECWRKVFEKSYVAVSTDGTLIQRLNKSDAHYLRGNHSSIDIVERNTTKMRVTKCAGSILLEDEYRDDEDDFDVVVAYCYKDDDGFYGKIETIKDVQRELNKRRSCIADIMVKCATYGWFYDRDTFGGDDSLKARFLDEVSRPGFAIEIESLQNMPFKIDGIRVPAELIAMDQMSQQTIYSLFNLPMEPQGVAQPDVSAKAILARQRQGLVANEFIWDNFSLMKKNLVKRVLKLIPQVWDGERIMRLLASQNDGKNWGPEIAKILENVDWTEYDVHIAQTLYAETARQANLEVWLEAWKNGFPVPPQVLFELSDLPDKELVMQQFQQQQQTQASAEADKNNTEKQKSKPKELQLLEAGVPVELAFGLTNKGGK